MIAQLHSNSEDACILQLLASCCAGVPVPDMFPDWRSSVRSRHVVDEATGGVTIVMNCFAPAPPTCWDIQEFKRILTSNRKLEIDGRVISCSDMLLHPTMHIGEVFFKIFQADNTNDTPPVASNTATVTPTVAFNTTNDPPTITLKRHRGRQHGIKLMFPNEYAKVRARVW